MNADDIKKLQSKIGTTVDGFWGPKSEAAARAYLKRLIDASGQKWPASDQASLMKFYGEPGDESKLMRIDVTGLGIKYEGREVKLVLCHKKVAESLKRVLTVISKKFPAIVGRYAGCFNDRPMRGTTATPSLHARGAAIDLAPETNGNHSHWPVAADMPFEVMEAFAREGWIAAGAFWSRDAMHFQATA